MSDSLKVALLGCGTVGGAVLRLLSEQSADLAARIGRPVEVVGVAVRRPDRHPFGVGHQEVGVGAEVVGLESALERFLLVIQAFLGQAAAFLEAWPRRV